MLRIFETPSPHSSSSTKPEFKEGRESVSSKSPKKSLLSYYNVQINKITILLHLLFRPAGLILYTFLHFESTPAIVTSVVIGLGIVFCGGAVVHNVFVWQKVHHRTDLFSAFAICKFPSRNLLGLGKFALSSLMIR